MAHVDTYEVGKLVNPKNWAFVDLSSSATDMTNRRA
jgi:hypothetical protein